MKTRTITVTEALGAAVWRLAPLWLTVAGAVVVGWLFSSFIDLVQAWALATGSGRPALL